MVVFIFKAQQKVNQNSDEEICRTFLANLLELSKKDPKPKKRIVHILVQELVDAMLEPEQFCDLLEKLLKTSAQPCLIAFLKVLIF